MFQNKTVLDEPPLPELGSLAQNEVKSEQNKMSKSCPKIEESKVNFTRNLTAVVALLIMPFSASARVSCPPYAGVGALALAGEVQPMEVNMFLNSEGKTTATLMDRVGPLSALGIVKIGSKKANAILFNNCIVTVSRHIFEGQNPKIGQEVPLSFGQPSGKNNFSLDVTGVVEVVPEVSDSDLKAMNSKKMDRRQRVLANVTDIVALRVPKKECSKLSGLTPATPMFESEEVVDLSFDNALLVAGTRESHELDKSMPGLGKVTSEKSLVEECYAPLYYSGQKEGIDGGAIYHNCSTVPGVSGAAIGTIEDTQSGKRLRVGAIMLGGLPWREGKGDNAVRGSYKDPSSPEPYRVIERSDDPMDKANLNNMTNSATPLAILGEPLLREMAGIGPTDPIPAIPYPPQFPARLLPLGEAL